MRIAVIGSSGGGTATLGHTDPEDLLNTIAGQLKLIDADLYTSFFVSIRRSFDGVSDDASASLYWHDEGKLKVERDNLKAINKLCGERQEKLAKDIMNQKIRGLICISCHPGIFASTLKAAAKMNIPVTGSGGSSLALMSALYNVQLIGNAGGSVATTTFTRAVSYTSAFASFWKRKYRPWLDAGERPSVISVLNSCLPSFWGVCLCKRILDDLNVIDRSTIDLIEVHALPTACALLMATSRSTDRVPSSSLMLSSALASLGAKGSILAGLLVGYMVSLVTERAMFFCIFKNIPATMTSLLTTGGIGGILMCATNAVAPVTGLISQQISKLILATVLFESRFLRSLSGFVWGILACYGSKIGLYHSVHLPLILLEMETGEPSFLGAVDELSLVLVCAGICCGNLFVSLIRPILFSPSDTLLSLRGLYINMAFGDFVEVCYPYMESNYLLNLGGYLASGVACAILTSAANSIEDLPKSSAYLPLPVAVYLAERNWKRMLLASFAAFSISFMFTILGHLSTRKENKGK